MEFINGGRPPDFKNNPYLSSSEGTELCFPELIYQEGLIPMTYDDYAEMEINMAVEKWMNGEYDPLPNNQIGNEDMNIDDNLLNQPGIEFGNPF